MGGSPLHPNQISDEEEKKEHDDLVRTSGNSLEETIQESDKKENRGDSGGSGEQADETLENSETSNNIG